MIECKHDVSLLVGMEDGIHCKGCGKVFKSLAEINYPPADFMPEPTPTVETPVAEKPKRRKRGSDNG